MCDELNEDTDDLKPTADKPISNTLLDQLDRIDHILNEVWPEYRGGESER